MASVTGGHFLYGLRLVFAENFLRFKNEVQHQLTVN